METIGYLETINDHGKVEKSSGRLNTAITAGICVLAALSKVAVQLINAFNKQTVNEDWTSIALLCTALLIGTGVVKASSKLKSK